MVLKLSWPMNHLLKKHPTDHFDVLTSHEQLIITVLHLRQWMQGHVQSSPGSLCGPIEVLGGPPVIHLDHVENHWTKVKDWSISEQVSVLQYWSLPLYLFKRSPKSSYPQQFCCSCITDIINHSNLRISGAKMPTCCAMHCKYVRLWLFQISLLPDVIPKRSVCQARVKGHTYLKYPIGCGVHDAVW